MQGHGYGQPVTQPPHTAWLVCLRVLFVAVGILTLGFLSWAMLLRLAIVTRRSLDWGLFVAVLVADLLAVVLLGLEPGDEVHTTGGYVGLILVLGTLVGSIAYYLAADIQHFAPRRQVYAGVPGAPAYGYPPAAAAYGATTVPTAPPAPTASTPAVPTPGTAPTASTPAVPAAPAPPRASGAPYTPPPVSHTPPPAPYAPVPAPPPAAPLPRPQAPARIEQVRAELDELSDYLRRQDGHEGGR
ncbi:MULTISPECIES: hypothetical protein [Streptomyces]|uniref:hypothetical protein n=1 Tax=Streptomyces TaxID=1883 RepID=UPI00167B718E|nr:MULTISPECIES: hypothetical protein [Streptomyces]MBK3525251.1 hypothetical protein [Streptomyces sp. MBT70]GGR62785.1 hypothetical protein GCM10010236_15130 [Streptomyces eurythermus]